ncbi:MAG: hypothetical protein CMB80_02815 [Flammeovirgaceae bacterium]|nr:hypothetical protein [Flammeovirgaceae bacterium]
MKKTEHYPKAEVFETIMDHIKEVAAIREYYEVGAISMDTFIEKYYQADSMLSFNLHSVTASYIIHVNETE